MVEEILFINIGYKDGLYVFENGDIDLDIPNEIMVNTPFYNQANSFEELVDTLLLEPEEHIVFTYNYNNQRLVRKLACTLLKEYEKTVYLINSNLCNAVCNVDSQNSLYLLKNYEDLHNVDQLSLQVITEIPELNLHSLPDIENSYYVTMRNGYDAFVTGIYPQNVSNTLAKHIQLEKHVTIKDTSEYLDINGAFLVNMEDVKDIDIQDKNNFNHLHIIKEEKVQFDETKVSLKNFICSYSQVEDIKRKGKCLLDYEYYLKIENKNDLEKFSVDLDFYKQTGKVDTISKRLVDECRWTNQCSLKRLTRYRVTEDGIKPCITSEKSLLESQEDHMMQLLEANKLCDKAMIQRNCMECAVKDVCSKCACLPNEISREEFCDFMHLYPFVGEYLRKKRIVNFLSKFSKIFEGNAYIEVSSSVHSFEYPIRKTKECAGREVFVFKKNANYYALHIQKGSLIRLEKKYVFLLEAWALERSAEEIVEKMAEKYNMDISSAKMVIEEGYYKLQKGGLI